MDLSVKLGSLVLKNPVMPASGTFGWGEEMEPYCDISKLGAVVPKSITVGPLEGNSPARTVETACGMLNAIGLQNPGVDAFLRNNLPKLAGYGIPVIVSISGFSISEYGQVAGLLEGKEGIFALEVNISCPNVEQGGIVFGMKPATVKQVVEEVKKNTSLPIIPKLSPSAAAIGEIARAAEDAGADALTVANTIKGMAVDWRTKKPFLANITGGLSGPAIKPHALYLVNEVSHAVSIPVIGCGGIMSADDVLEYIICGATAVQVGTANFANPGICSRLPGELEKLLAAEGVEKLSDLIGAFEG